MSPMAFALAACGGGGGGRKSEPNVILFGTPEDELIGLMTQDSKFTRQSLKSIWQTRRQPLKQ